VGRDRFETNHPSAGVVFIALASPGQIRPEAFQHQLFLKAAGIRGAKNDYRP
jgi:hypothetical protein